MIASQDNFWVSLEGLPKIDLHRHLEGSLRLSTLSELVIQEKLDLPSDPKRLASYVQVLPSDPKSPQNFLSKFEVIRQFFTSPETIQRFAREVVIDAAQDHVRYLELRFTPAALAYSRGFPLSEVTDWVIEAVYDEARQHEIGLGLILSINRHEPIAIAEQVAQIAADRVDRGIVGLGLAGYEVDHPAHPFASIFRAAKGDGLGITVHAGEWINAGGVMYAMQEMGATRIGHGIRVMEDHQAVAYALENRIVFEVCPTSNLLSGAVAKISDHPLPQMVEEGLLVTIHSDDPSIFDIRLTDEFTLLIDSMDFSITSLYGMTLTAIQSAFQSLAFISSLEDELIASFFISSGSVAAN